MRKVVFLTMIALLLSAPAMGTVIYDGDAAFYYLFALDGDVAEVVPGEVWVDDGLATVNWAWIGPCGNAGTWPDPDYEYADTFCMVLTDKGVIPWNIYPEWAYFDDFDGYDTQTLMLSGYVWNLTITAEIPCTGATPGMIDTIFANIAFADTDRNCDMPPQGCPGGWGGTGTDYLTIYQPFEVVAPPPTVTIYQDSLYFLEEGLAAGYIPFGIANDNYCYPLSNFDYVITSKGHIGGVISDSGSGSAGAGELVTVYTIMDASLADACDYDTLTIIAWNATAGDYDTCVQIVHVIEPAAVPLFTAPVVTIMVLAMILAAAVIMRRHAVSKA